MRQEDNKQAVAVFKRSAVKLHKQATSLVISDDDQLANAAGLLGSVKSEQKHLKAQKKKIIDPMQEALKEIKALFAEPEGTLSDIEQLLKDGMLAYHDKKDAAAQKRIDSINNRIGSGRGKLKVETAMAQLSGIDQAESSVMTGSGGAQFKLGPQKVRITDPSLLPEDFLYRERVLEALRIEIAQYIKEGGQCPAGAEVYREKVVAGVTS